MAEERAQRRLAAILAADVAGYSRLMGADEEDTLARFKAHRQELVDPKIAEHRGRIVKTTGDGLLAEFASVVDAVRCALTVQHAMAGRNAELPDAKRIEFRIGINLGDIIVDGCDIHGDGVNVAARLESLAEPGGICISSIVHESVGNRLDEEFSDGGEHKVKNISRPVHVWRWRSDGVPSPRAVEPSSSPSAKPCVAILPFDNMVNDPAHQYLADGLCEDLTTALSKIDALTVISRTAAFVYRNRKVSAVEAGRELAAEYVLEGSVQTAGRRVRINAQLIDRETDGHIWAQKFDGEIDDVFELQDAITQQIVAVLEVKLSDGAQVMVWRDEAGDPKAYEHFLAGRTAYKEYSRAGNSRARRGYEEALKVSPRFISAMAGLARTYIEDANFSWSPDRVASLEEARRLLEGAFEIDPDHPLARAELAHALAVEGRLEQARAEAMKSVSADPNLADAHQVLATVLVCLGEHEEALRHLRMCLKLSPRPPDFYQIWKAEALVGLSRFAEAQSVLQLIIARQPEWLMAHALSAIAYQLTGEEQAAQAAIRRMRDINARFTVSRWHRSLLYPQRPDVARLRQLLIAAGLPE